MTAYNGRGMTISWDGTTIVGVKTKATTMSNALVDVTSDDDDGWQTYLPEAGLKSIQATVSFIAASDVLLAEFFNASVTGETLVMALPFTVGNKVYTGTFLVQDVEFSGEHDGAVEGSATFVSTGAVVLT